MRQNKGGPSEYVYVSPAWEDLAIYCVRQLIRYGDEVREFAAPEERHLLILVSTWNWTKGADARAAIIPAENQDFTRRGCLGGPLIPRPSSMKRWTGALSLSAFRNWLSGTNYSNKGKLIGVLERWGITEDGAADSPIAKINTHYGRHTRQYALTLNKAISPVIRQRDLNHRNANMQVFYQHAVDEQNAELMAKVTEQALDGSTSLWLSEILGISVRGEESNGPLKYRPGLYQMLTPRWRRLLENNLLYGEPNSVPPGICAEGRPENCLPTRMLGKAGRRVIKAADSTQPDATLDTRKTRQKKNESRAPTGLDTRLPPNDSEPAVGGDVIRRLRDRQKQVREQIHGQSDEQL